MGFDIECIIDIHSYPGEYFCPVCRTLVYPNEAFQAQCTHLYCKACLVHIANGSKACPYDGYLVTESDSKPLAESDKALAEKVGKVRVHCLYFRSGCSWEGTLSDCPSHCAGCSFGNSPVICNRCGIQIIHRQVHDHAQICPGGYDGQQAVASSGVTRSVTTPTSITAVANQTVAQSGAPVPQTQNPQNVSATQLPGQNANLQTNAPTAAPAAMPAPDQWYQQQYQQYYQQYMGYDPYQQQHYYPTQQQQFQQYQQHVVHVQGQHQSHVYSQAVVPPQPQGQAPSQAQVQPQPHLLQLQPPQQINPVAQASQQPHLQLQAQGQAQPPPQPQLQMMPQAQAQLPSQGQAQANAPGQALAPNYQINQQQQPHRPQTQIAQQALPPPPPQPPQFPQAVGMRPAAQHAQVPQHQQGQGQMHHPQGSQAHLQPQMHPQTQGYVQSSNQSNVQSQHQAQHYQPQHPVFHSQTNQPAAPAAPPQAPHPPPPPVSGHHSYQQPQTAQKMQTGASQQHAVLPYPTSGSMHSVQGYAQTLQQPTPLQPPQSHSSFSQQQPSAPVPLQNQVAGIPHAPHQQFLPHGQQPTHPIQHRLVMQPVQPAPPHNYAQQQQFTASFQGQLHQHGHLPQQPPIQSQMQMRPPGPPQPQQSQNYPGTPLMPNQGIPHQSHQMSSGGFGASSHSGPAHGGLTQSSISQNQNYAKPAELQQNATDKEIRSPKKELAEKGFEGDSLKEEAGTGFNGTLDKDADDSAKDGSVKSVTKQEKGDLMGLREQANEGVENENHKENVRTLLDSAPLKQADPENLAKLSKTAAISSGNFGNETVSGISISSAEGNALPPRSHGSHQERSQAQVQGHLSSTAGVQGPGALHHAGQSVNLSEGKVPGNLGGLPKSFELSETRETMGKPPFESHYGSQHVRPMSSDQMPGSGEWRSFTKSHSDEPNIRMNGGAAPDPSMFGSRDENSNHMSKEPTRTFDQAPRLLDKPLQGHSYDAVSKLDPGATGPHSRFLPHDQSGGRGHGDMFGPGPEFGHRIKPFPYRSPGRDYPGSPSRRFGGPSSFPRGISAFEDHNSREAHRFGEGSRSFNLSSDLVRNQFRDDRFPPLPGHIQRGDLDDHGNHRYGEHMAPDLHHNQIGADDVFGPDGPGHLMKGKFPGPGYLPGHFIMSESAGPGPLPGHGRAGELTGNFPHPPFSQSARGDMPSFLHLGEPPMRNNYPYHGMPNAVHFSGGLDSFDQSRKRKPISNGWCRICEFDCETVEGLEMHSQTREHQNMAMDMVKRIKLQNKKQRAPGGHKVHEGGSRTRKVGTVGHGSKP
ncbi:mediator of RNA polymerase II transcription subunit 12-like [Salvia divinorum]|uniref:Mediator of RNA polymerase II transcription subunit 12-like n=1 Tax=Salvia divinorum TaxID=28513 RepID=A0ABD1HPQ9_SALDI